MPPPSTRMHSTPSPPSRLRRAADAQVQYAVTVASESSTPRRRRAGTLCRRRAVAVGDLVDLADSGYEADGEVSVGYDSHGDGEHQDLVDGDGNEEIMLFVHPKVGPGYVGAKEHVAPWRRAWAPVASSLQPVWFSSRTATLRRMQGTKASMRATTRCLATVDVLATMASATSCSDGSAAPRSSSLIQLWVSRSKKCSSVSSR
nr:uncharacterized protein LOC127305947 isoform X2 [Lolium perenne]XP_051192505.1 uncharacterized protein LOC127305947 isoform X2 [Lolium perenne]